MRTRRTRVDDPRLERLLNQLLDSNQGVRLAAVRSFRALPDGLAVDAGEALFRMMDPEEVQIPDACVRHSVAEAMAALGARAALAVELMDEFLWEQWLGCKDGQAAVMLTALELLGKRCRGASRGLVATALLSRIGEHKGPDRACALFLEHGDPGVADDPAILRRVREVLKRDSGIYDWQNAVRILGKLATRSEEARKLVEDRVHTLDELHRDRDGFVHPVTCEALAMIGPRCSDRILPVLLAALEAGKYLRSRGELVRAIIAIDPKRASDKTWLREALGGHADGGSPEKFQLAVLLGFGQEVRDLTFPVLIGALDARRPGTSEYSPLPPGFLSDAEFTVGQLRTLLDQERNNGWVTVLGRLGERLQPVVGVLTELLEATEPGSCARDRFAFVLATAVWRMPHQDGHEGRYRETVRRILRALATEEDRYTRALLIQALGALEQRIPTDERVRKTLLALLVSEEESVLVRIAAVWALWGVLGEKALVALLPTRLAVEINSADLLTGDWTFRWDGWSNTRWDKGDDMVVRRARELAEGQFAEGDEDAAELAILLTRVLEKR